VLLVKENSAGKTELSILRKGHVLKSDVEQALQSMSFEFIEKVDKKESPGHMKHHYMPAVPFIVCTDKSRDIGSIIAEVNRKITLLPDEIESIKITKPAHGIQSMQVLTLSSDPVIAAREFYGKLREAADQGKDSILFFKDSQQVGERWESLFDRLNKAASLIL
jgi:L-threonylcarbamoyladenylate synthase